MAAADLLQTMLADLLAANQGAAEVLVRHGMSCLGCAFARFETVAEAAAIYGIDPLELARRLAAAPPQPALEDRS
jgi:hybrid cluster-associated redox disulfide protein